MLGMVSRDTAVHVVVVLLAFVLLVIAETAGLPIEDGSSAAIFFVVLYGLILGGAHLFLALRGEDGMIPVDARWRYVTALAIVLVGGALAFYGTGEIGPLEVDTLGYVLVAVTVAVYVVVEGMAGYRETRPDAENS